MLTSGDIEFEPQQPKIWQLTSSIVIMAAGDAALQSEIIRKVAADVQRRVETEPQNWWSVSDVADLYSRYYGDMKVRRSEVAILSPLGLNRNTFIDRQQQMAPSLVSQIAQQMINFEMPKVEAIITGIDPSGSHIYVAEDGDISCFDVIAFASVGVGRWHANSQFMFSGHTRQQSMPRTAYLTFSAKRHAEVAPGVGSGTDMFLIFSLGQYTSVGDHILNALDKSYKSNQKEIKKASQKAEEGFASYLAQLVAAPPAPEQKAPSGSGSQPADLGTSDEAISVKSNEEEKTSQT
jgi:hypothetical protein